MIIEQNGIFIKDQRKYPNQEDISIINVSLLYYYTVKLLQLLMKSTFIAKKKQGISKPAK